MLGLKLLSLSSLWLRFGHLGIHVRHQLHQRLLRLFLCVEVLYTGADLIVRGVLYTGADLIVSGV